ncbi:MAG: acetate--CoA ligase [Candidatus Bathyarchaeia archaeon]
MRNTVRWVVEDPEQKEVYWPSEELKKIAWISDSSIYDHASKDPVKFWESKAREGLTWFKEWTEAYRWDPPFYKWFIGGKINVCYNAVDRHVQTWRRNKAAIIWEPEPTNEQPRILTYFDLYREVNKFANVLKKLGVKKGDRVGIYLPMIPEVQIAMLACARIGAIHSVVFSAFSAESLKGRLLDAEPQVLITADGYYRRGAVIDLKQKADQAIEGTTVKKVVVVKRTGMEAHMQDGRDLWWHELMADAPAACEPEVMDSEDMLFILYTSGTTGKPKGIQHSTGGYATVVYWTAKWDFDLHDEDVFWCTADIGWVTGHSYSCYGPLLNGATMIVYEGSPDYPNPSRWWQIVEKYGVTVFYTAPTAIRMFMKWGDEYIKGFDLSSIRILATVGEPIDRDSWMWYFNTIGGGRCPIIDTWWQTETGGTLINSLPGIGPFIPTVAGRSFPGVIHKILDEEGKESESGYLVQVSPFAPSLLRNIYRDPERFKIQYFSRFGDKFYFAGDGARIYDKIGNIRVTGRVDDVLKVAGHRISTAEVEDAINRHSAVTESAVIGVPHPIKGEVPVAFVVLAGAEGTPQLEKELIKQVDVIIGPIARPEKIYFVEDLPKTRSGKIMRRILRKVAVDEDVGDTTTLMNPDSVSAIQVKVREKK